MPVMNGFELAQLIREQDRDVLIFFLTDRTEKAYPSRSIPKNSSQRLKSVSNITSPHLPLAWLSARLSLTAISQP